MALCATACSYLKLQLWWLTTPAIEDAQRAQPLQQPAASARMSSCSFQGLYALVSTNSHTRKLLLRSGWPLCLSPQPSPALLGRPCRNRPSPRPPSHQALALSFTALLPVRAAAGSLPGSFRQVAAAVTPAGLPVMVVAVARGPAAPAVADGAAAAGSSSSPKEPPGSRPSDFKATQQQEKALDLLFCFYESLLWRRCRRGRWRSGPRWSG